MAAAKGNCGAHSGHWDEKSRTAVEGRFETVADGSGQLRTLKSLLSSRSYWMHCFEISVFAVGGLLEEVTPQSAGHLPFVRDATANYGFHIRRNVGIDPRP